MILFTLSSTLNIESLDNIIFLCHVMGLAPNHFPQDLVINVYVHQVFHPTWRDVNQFRTSLWTNEYELQFHSHNDVEHICAKMQWTMGANVHPPIPIKSTIHVGANLGPSLGGVRKNLDFQQNCKVF